MYYPLPTHTELLFSYLRRILADVIKLAMFCITPFSSNIKGKGVLSFFRSILNNFPMHKLKFLSRISQYIQFS